MTRDVAFMLAYVGAGLLLPLFYLPQIRACLRDRSGLAGFSLGKCVVQTVLRAAMFPFVAAVGNSVMSAIVLLDVLGRMVELAVAVAVLRRQGWSWRRIAARMGLGAAQPRRAEPASPVSGHLR